MVTNKFTESQAATWTPGTTAGLNKQRISAETISEERCCELEARGGESGANEKK